MAQRLLELSGFEGGRCATAEVHRVIGDVPGMAAFIECGHDRGVAFAIRGNLIILAPPPVIEENVLERALDTMDDLLAEVNWT